MPNLELLQTFVLPGTGMEKALTFKWNGFVWHQKRKYFLQNPGKKNASPCPDGFHHEKLMPLLGTQLIVSETSIRGFLSYAYSEQLCHCQGAREDSPSDPSVPGKPLHALSVCTSSNKDLLSPLRPEGTCLTIYYILGIFFFF